MAPEHENENERDIEVERGEMQPDNNKLNFSTFDSSDSCSDSDGIKTASFDNSLIFQEDDEDFCDVQKRQRYSRFIALALGVATLMAVALGIYFFMDRNDMDLQRSSSSSGEQHEDFQGTVAMALIEEEHAVPEDCWIAIHGTVYDLTQYAPIHPGEPTLITRHCGTDATTAYDFEHSTALLPIVDQFRLGTLVFEEQEQVVVETQEPTTTTTTTTSSAPIPVSVPGTTSPPPVEITVTTPSPTPMPVTPPPTEPDATPFPTATPVTPPPTTSAPTGCPMEFYTLQDVAQHPDEVSCWYVLYGVVYDFTSYVDDHKGGRGTILAECGTDATVPYELEKKHDVDLLIKKSFQPFIIGRLGPTRYTGDVPCDEVDLVAVTVPIERVRALLEEAH
ncbi:MAG: hypothetical protein SGILL_004570 [Bacillariaceae sp.]